MKPNSEDRDIRRLLLGLGLDARDGQKRLTKGENFVLLGGSEETHERMTETAIKVNEKLAKRGKNINNASDEELRDVFGEFGS